MKKPKKPDWGGRGNGFAWWLVILLFVAVFLAVQLAEGAVIAAVALLTFFFDRLPDSLPKLTALFSTVLGTAVVLLFCRFAEGRRPRDLGLSPSHAGQEYLAGLPVGLLLFAGAVGISVPPSILICIFDLTFVSHRESFGDAVAESALRMPLFPIHIQSAMSLRTSHHKSTASAYAFGVPQFEQKLPVLP